MLENITETTILWEGLHWHGHEAARLLYVDGCPHLEGSAVFHDEQQSCCLSYQIVCDSQWQTQQVNVRGWVGNQTVAKKIAVVDGVRWLFNGKEVRGIQGCVEFALARDPELISSLLLNECAPDVLHL